MFNCDVETNLPHKLLLTDRQVKNLHKAFAHNSSVNIKLSKIQLSKIVQLGRFLGRILGSLLRMGLPLMKSVIQPLAKSVLIPLGLTAAASVADAGIHKKILGSWATTLTISNREMEKVMKILKGVSKTIQNEAKNKKEDFSVCY